MGKMQRNLLNLYHRLKKLRKLKRYQNLRKNRRVQKERFTDLAQYEEVRDQHEITPELMAEAKEKMVVMHPLPRVGEIHYAVDNDPRAAYFRQMKYGLHVRMALLAEMLAA